MGAAMWRVLVGSWNHRGVLPILLWPFSLVYGALAALRRFFYRTGICKVRRVAVPVVVVGNVVAGGAGKTPVVMAVVQHLQSRGLKPGVLSRGHGRRAGDCREVLEDSLPGDVGDEPMLIRQTTGSPVFVARARVDAARALLQRYPDVDVLVCDDGLQHYGLHRDIEICVFDERGIGNGFLLPAGPLREPWPRPIDLVLSNDKQLSGQVFSFQRALAAHARRADGSSIALADLRAFTNRPEARLRAVAGIARPEAFFAMLRAQGLPIAHTEALPDHADFAQPAWSTANSDILVCTEKDAVKLWRHRPDALAVALLLRIDPAFWVALDKLLNTLAGSKLSSGHGHTTS